MSVDNRTTLNDCSATTGWTGDDSVTVTTDTGNFYEGSSALSTQLSNSDEHMYTTSIGGTRDLSDAQVWMLIKDNLVDTEANGGVKYVLHDGTDRVGYEIGGNDNVGFPLTIFFNSYRLDTTNLPAGFFVFAGVEANLTLTAITGVGYGTIHLAKAVGSIDNVFMDRFSFIANDSPALTINGGTVGTPETLSDVAADDITNGWGLVNNPKGSEFGIFCSTEWGDSGTADSYFEQVDSQIFLDGRGVGATHFDMTMLGNATGTNSFRLVNCVVVNLGALANWDFSGANFDVVKIEEGVQFVDNGAFTFPAQDVGNKFLADVIFVNCGQVDPSTIDMDRVTFNGSSDANGALLADGATTSNMSDLIFNSDGTGHAIHMNLVGAGPFTLDFDNWKFTGYAASDGSTGDEVILVDGASDPDVTINVLNGGDTPSVMSAAGYTGTVTINNSVTVTVQGVTEGTSITVEADETVGTVTDGDVLGSGFADSAGEFSFTQNYEAAFDPSGLDVIVRARNQGIAVAAIAEDNTAFTDETSEANSNVTADMTLLPAVPVAGQDYYYFGHNTEFGALKLFISTAGIGTYSITWQYWNGAWTNLSGVTDGTNSYKNLGENSVSYTIPGDWVDTTINSQGPLRYVRASLNAGTVTTVPVSTKVTLNTQKYLPFNQSNILTSSGLTVTASWTEDNIAQF